MCIEAQPETVDIPGSPASPLGALSKFNFQCQCKNGFEGNFCETAKTPVNPCNSNPCDGVKLSVKSEAGHPIGAGECSASTDLTSFSCNCLPGIEGTNKNSDGSFTECEKDLDFCPDCDDKLMNLVKIASLALPQLKSMCKAIPKY